MIFDRFKNNNKDYARQFKEAMERGEGEKAAKILDDWNKYNDSDCNFLLALVCIKVTQKIGEPSHWIDLYKRGTSGLAEEWGLSPWFQRNADIVMQENGILTEKEILEIKSR